MGSVRSHLRAVFEAGPREGGHMVTEESIGDFFAGPTHHLTQRGAVFERQFAQFFTDLEFRLEVARASKRHLDRYLASDFDVFRYISPDENRLSDILVDLLNPDGLHGQRDLFLREFLRRISADANRYDADLNRYNLSKFRGVVREDAARYIIASQRRIDITIDFGNAAIGIENKPWAGEQPDQLRDYAAHLAKKYRENFLLVYLSGDGSAPQTLPKQQQDDLRKNGRFGILTYRLDLHPWLESCAKECEAEKVRWFLRDFTAYVAREFPIPEQA
jgi:hypothetical protein